MLPAVPPELSVTERLAFRVPAAEGVNVTLIRHVPFDAIERLAVQVVPAAIAKSPALAPPIANGVADKTRFVCPVFVTVTGMAPLVVPTFCGVLNVIDDALRVAIGTL
jgi:hypothetical protein